MVDFRRLVSKQTAAVGLGRREGKSSKDKQKEAHCFHTAASRAKGGPLIPIPSHEAADFTELFLKHRKTASNRSSLKRFQE